MWKYKTSLRYYELYRDIQLAGLIILIDFEKAYDLLSWNLIFYCLNFSKSIQQWIKGFYKKKY